VHFMHFEADFVREKLTSIGDISNHVDLVNAHAGTPSVIRKSRR
jgi:hypothetical protein